LVYPSFGRHRYPNTVRDQLLIFAIGGMSAHEPVIARRNCSPAMQQGRGQASDRGSVWCADSAITFYEHGTAEGSRQYRVSVAVSLPLMVFMVLRHGRSKNCRGICGIPCQSRKKQFSF
jgi:hypothetical protein